MNIFSAEYLPYTLLALLVGAILLFLLLRPRQRVRLSDTAPVRPHMAVNAAPDAPSPSQTPLPTVAPNLETLSDDFQRMKGVGPKLAELLRARGFARFDQLAALEGDQLNDVDQQLGAFKGRLSRDRIPEQASFLARGDVQGFEQAFGKLKA